jgi:serine/threonine protein kinase
MNETSLQSLLQRNADLTNAIRYSILQQVADALDTAHRRSVVHGNLSPASILLRDGLDGSKDSFPADSIVLKDFGAQLDLDKEIAGSNFVPESAFYASPERILGIPLDGRSDEFSLATIAYEQVSGRRPFEAGEVSRLFFQICSEPQQPITALDSRLTESVNAAFERGLAKEREQRFATCGEFVRVLGEALVKCRGWEALAPLLVVPEVVGAPRGAAAPRSGAPGTAAAPQATPPQAPPSPTRPIVSPRREPQYEWPPLRRRRDLDEEPDRGSSLGKTALIIAACLFLVGAGVFLMNWKPKPNVPVQVLDTHVGESSPPPPDAGSQTSHPQGNRGGQSAAPQDQPAPLGGTSSQQTQPPQQTQPAQTQAPQQGELQAPVPKAPLEIPPPAVSAPQEKAQAAPPPSSSRPAPSARRSAQNGGGGLATVDLLTEPPGARVMVDGNSSRSCTAPCTLQLANGRHTLTADLAGYGASQRVFNVPDENTLYIALARRTGALVVTSSPSSATIFIDGKNAGLTPETLHLPPGPHLITLVNGAQRYQATVNVVADGIQATGYTFPK